MEKLLISACLLGVSSRYDARSVSVLTEEQISLLNSKYQLVPFCPEIYGGLPTPRTPSEIVGDEVYMKDGTCVTENYRKGAEEAVRLCKLLGIEKALMKERSPSCGAGKVYDGSFMGKLTAGDGVAVKFLKKNGIEIYKESDIEKLL